MDVDESLLSMTLDEMVRVKDVIVTPIPKDSPNSTEAIDTTPSESDDISGDGEERAIYLPPFFYSEVGEVERNTFLICDICLISRK